METTVEGPCDVSFYWKVDSQYEHDYLRFYIDGAEQDKISGSTSWAQKTYSISGGSHTLTWKYTKDSSGSNPGDCSWVDMVSITEDWCAAESAVHQAKISEPDDVLNPLRRMRDDSLKDDYVARYYDYSPDLVKVMAKNPALVYETASLIVKHSTVVEHHVKGIKDEKVITRGDVEELVSFAEKLRIGVLANSEQIGIGAERSEEIVNFIDEFKEQIEASLGKTFSEALRDSVYYKSKGVTELNVTPAVVVQGETVSITGKALPNEPVWLKFSFAISLPVSEGNYSRDFTGIHLPTGNKSLFLTVENVKDIQIIFEAGGDTIEYYSNVTGGIFTIFIPETDIPPGKCNITVCGNATDDATSVNLTTDMSIKVIADSNGDFSLNISTEGVPIGEYQITAGAIERTVLVVSALVHNLNTGENFSTIQAAVDAVNTTDGHTITVAPITYNENVNVYKSLTIKSTSGNPDDAMVQALDSNDHVFEVTADYVNLLGFTATGATGDEKAGIYLYSVKHCIISDNNASNNYYGIRVAGSSSYCEIDNNIVLNNLNAGISVK